MDSRVVANAPPRVVQGVHLSDEIDEEVRLDGVDEITAQEIDENEAVRKIRQQQLSQEQEL